MRVVFDPMRPDACPVAKSSDSPHIAETLIQEDNSSLENHCSHSSGTEESDSESYEPDNSAGFTQTTGLSQRMALEVSVPHLQVLKSCLKVVI